MIVNQIERIVKNSQTPVVMNMKGIKFVCAPVSMTGFSKPHATVWYYIGSEDEKVFGNAKEMFVSFLQPKCAHNNTELNTSGGMSYGTGDVSDTIEEELFCLDCGKTLEVK